MTKDEWLKSSIYWAIQTMHGRRTPIIDNVKFTPLWWIGTQPIIRIFTEPKISRETMLIVSDMISKTMTGIDASIINPPRIELCGYSSSAVKQINDACVAGKINDNRLADIALSEDCRKSQQHGDVYITTKEFVDDKVSWGAASFEHGMMVLSLYGDRQNNKNFLRNVVHHELGHMLGLRLHCDQYDVDSYTYDQNCVMHYSCPSSNMCQKCKDWIRQWWVQIKHELSK